jgi:hypothetical protein
MVMHLNTTHTANTIESQSKDFQLYHLPELLLGINRPTAAGAE